MGSYDYYFRVREGLRAMAIKEYAILPRFPELASHYRMLLKAISRSIFFSVVGYSYAGRYSQGILSSTTGPIWSYQMKFKDKMTNTQSVKKEYTFG